MSWRCVLGDTVTGRLAQRVDIPNFSWSVTVSDASLRTSVDRGAGETSASGITLPWSAVPGSTRAEKASSVASYRRSLTLMWDEGGLLAPVVWGAVGLRTDSYLDTSFDLVSAMGLLSGRYLVREGVFGASEGTTRDEIALSGLSQRAIACEAVRLCTSAKPGGALPIDLPYLGEAGAHERSFKGFDVQNLACSDVIEGITSVQGGPDVQLRPYLADGSRVRLRLLAGSDADVYLGQSDVHALTCFAGGGTAQDLRVDHAPPVMRVYATGSGTDEGKLCALAEDLSLCRTSDPWPLLESALSEPDADDLSILSGRAGADLAGSARPVMQLSCRVDFDDPAVPPPGSIWPGEVVRLVVEDHPALPDGVYESRLMQMSGDQSSVATLVFDPVYETVW